MSFLTAEWRKLAIINYEVDESLLKKYIPAKTELDKWNGTNYVSLVGFMFMNTKLKGIPVPYHQNFEEVNLRFYVRYKDKQEWKRGVVFIKEIVPRSAISFIANTFYKEHYQTMKMAHRWEVKDQKRITEYKWQHQNKWHSFLLESDTKTQAITKGSETAFITEHYWGYTKINENQTFEYEVTHPKWEVYPITNFQINVDFGALYSKEFEVLNTQNPVSVMLAEGSGITVEGKRKL